MDPLPTDSNTMRSPPHYRPNAVLSWLVALCMFYDQDVTHKERAADQKQIAYWVLL